MGKVANLAVSTTNSTQATRGKKETVDSNSFQSCLKGQTKTSKDTREETTENTIAASNEEKIGETAEQGQDVTLDLVQISVDVTNEQVNEETVETTNIQQETPEESAPLENHYLLYQNLVMMQPVQETEETGTDFEEGITGVQFGSQQAIFESTTSISTNDPIRGLTEELEFSTTNLAVPQTGTSEKLSEVETSKRQATVEKPIVQRTETMPVESTTTLDPAMLESAKQAISLPAAFASEMSNEPAAKSVETLAQPIVKAIETMERPGMQKLTLQLLPENLGKMQVSIKVTNHNVELEFVVQNPQTKQALESIANKLEQAIQKPEFTVAQPQPKITETQAAIRADLSGSEFSGHAFQQEFGQGQRQASRMNKAYQQPKVESVPVEKEEKQSESTVSILA